MALEAYIDSNGQLVPLAAPNHETGGFLESISSSILLPKGGLSKAPAASHLGYPFGNLNPYGSVARMPHLNPNLLYGNRSSTALNNSTNSGHSIGANSLDTDANSTLSYGVHLQKSSSGNMDSYLNVPSSPLSFSSNNLNSSAIDSSSITQPNSSFVLQKSQLSHKRRQPQHQEPCTLTQMCKKPRLDINLEYVLHQQFIQQLLQLQDQKRRQQALLQQHNLQNQQQQQQRQIFQLTPAPLLGVPAQLQQQQQMRHHLKQLANHQLSAVQSLDSGICSRRLMQYIYHLQHRPRDNSITYWRKFVAEYYAPGAKKRWCLSLCDGIGKHALGIFSKTAMEAWHCEICGSKSGKGFEAIFEILPWLNKIKYESGVIDELLFLDFPHESRFPSGLMMLRYEKAVQESVYEQFRVVHEGQLRVLFGHDLKILYWEFCAHRCEEFVPRRLIAPQVSRLVHAARKYQSTTKDGRSDGVSLWDLQLNCNLFLTAESQLKRNLDSLLVNELGFSKRYVRCLQIAEVVKSMKDLMTYSHDKNIGPIESLKKYGREEIAANNQTRQMHGLERLASAEDLLTNCYKKLSRQNSISSAGKQVPSCLMNCSSQMLSSPDLVPHSPGRGVFQTSPINAPPSSQPSGAAKNLQPPTIKKLQQEMMSNRKPKGVHNPNVKVKEEVLEELEGNTAGMFSTGSRGTGPSVGSGLGPGNTSFAAAGNFPGCFLGKTDGFYGNNALVKQEPDLFEEFQVLEAVRGMNH